MSKAKEVIEQLSFHPIYITSGADCEHSESRRIEGTRKFELYCMSGCGALKAGSKCPYGTKDATGCPCFVLAEHRKGDIR